MHSTNSQNPEIRSAKAAERRREPREARSVPVEVSGYDVRGRFFTEQTTTLDVSESGCRFQLNAELEKNSAVSVRVIRRSHGFALPDPPVLFRVAWIKQTHPGWMVAGAKLQPVHLWTVGFPADTGDNSADDPSDTSPDEPPAA